MLFLVTLAADDVVDQAPPAGEEVSSAASVVRIYYDDLEQLRLLSGYDLWEYNNRRERYVLAFAGEDEVRAMREAGFRVELDLERTEKTFRKPVIDKAQTGGIPGFPCYRTVEETFSTAVILSDIYPTLAEWIDVGDSWEKTAGLGGYDMNVLRLTNRAIAGPKPKLFATSSIHAREYTPAELLTRFAEYLLDGYGVDGDATWLLDHHEIHLMLQGNPDARKHAEAGQYWRKNTNQNYCTPISPFRGVDLNRNFDFEWGCCNGSSTGECESTYRGPLPASDPETQAIAGHMLSIFPDQRAPALDAAAPADTTGIYLDVHSWGRLVLWPWGFGGAAPNEAALQTLGRKLAFFNSYTPQQGVELYPTDGTTTDFAYGELGIAAFTYELGTTFFQDCETFENRILPDNLTSLVYAAKAARRPYLTPLGPDATELELSAVVVDPGESVTLTAWIDDGRYFSAAQPVQAIAAAELYVDIPPWSGSATPVAIPLGPTDGMYDTSLEEVSTVLDTTGFELGPHVLFVRGQDSEGNWGAISAVILHVAGENDGRAVGTVRDAGSGQPLSATVRVERIGAQTTSDETTGAYTLRLPAGSWDLTASAVNYLSVTVNDVSITDGVDAVVDFDLTPAPPILLVDDDDNVPDVRQEYTEALDGLGESYFVWDTINSDNEPDLGFLGSFETVIWFTGDEWGGSAGPGPVAESALGAWLDTGRCLFLSSQDYYRDRGQTDFMSAYLGVGSATNDVNHQHVTGLGSVYGQLGTYTLFFPYTNFTDIIQPDFSGEPAFGGTYGTAGVTKDTGRFRTTFVSFGLEVLATPTDRQAVLTEFFDWCADLQLDDDNDGTANATDCAPSDPQAWSEPSPASDLRLHGGDTDNLSWSSPATGGASAFSYDVLRSPIPESFGTASCVATGLSNSVATDAESPVAGEVFHYLVRVRNACGATLGESSSGAARLAPDCP